MEVMMTNQAVAVVLRVLDAIEARRLDELASLYHPEIEFHWPPGLPYSGDFSGPGIMTMSQQFGATWMPLQPDAETRRLDPRVIAATDDTVVVQYSWRGRAVDGRYFETETLAHYVVRDDRLASARMYYYDLPGLVAFLGAAHGSPAA
jgi:ketosteroid isomerase-like protein